MHSMHMAKKQELSVQVDDELLIIFCCHSRSWMLLFRSIAFSVCSFLSTTSPNSCSSMDIVNRRVNAQCEWDSNLLYPLILYSEHSCMFVVKKNSESLIVKCIMNPERHRLLLLLLLTTCRTFLQMRQIVFLLLPYTKILFTNTNAKYFFYSLENCNFM